jgi:hypothetical protein
MKNILILIVAAAVFLHFYPQPEVTKFYDETKQSMLNGFAEFSDTSVSLKADKIFIDLKPQLNAFSDEEITSLKEMTSSRDNVKDFYHNHCQKKTRSAIFHPANQAKICKTISNYRKFL